MQRIVAELIERIGFADTMELVRRWGNRRLDVPMKVAPGDPLALTLGLEGAQRLVQHYAGQRLELPAEKRAMRDHRDEAIFAESATMSQEALGLRWGLTRQGVGAVLRRMRERRPQQVAGIQTGHASGKSAP